MSLLNKAYKKINYSLEKTKKMGDEYEYSILTDGGINRKRINVMNLCVQRTCFINSIKNSANAH